MLAALKQKLEKLKIQLSQFQVTRDVEGEILDDLSFFQEILLECVTSIRKDGIVGKDENQRLSSGREIKGSGRSLIRGEIKRKGSGRNASRSGKSSAKGKSWDKNHNQQNVFDLKKSEFLGLENNQKLNIQIEKEILRISQASNPIIRNPQQKISHPTNKKKYIYTQPQNPKILGKLIQPSDFQIFNKQLYSIGFEKYLKLKDFLKKADYKIRKGQWSNLDMPYQEVTATTFGRKRNQPVLKNLVSPYITQEELKNKNKPDSMKRKISHSFFDSPEFSDFGIRESYLKIFRNEIKAKSRQGQQAAPHQTEIENMENRFKIDNSSKINKNNEKSRSNLEDKNLDKNQLCYENLKKIDTQKNKSSLLIGKEDFENKNLLVKRNYEDTNFQNTSEQNLLSNTLQRKNENISEKIQIESEAPLQKQSKKVKIEKKLKVFEREEVNSKSLLLSLIRAKQKTLFELKRIKLIHRKCLLQKKQLELQDFGQYPE